MDKAARLESARMDHAVMRDQTLTATFSLFIICYTKSPSKRNQLLLAFAARCEMTYSSDNCCEEPSVINDA